MLYQIKKDVTNNIVFISSENSTGREINEFNVGKFNWIQEEEPQKKLLLIKIRHGENFYNCNLTLNDDGMGSVKLDKPDKGIAAGQFAVFYDDEVCLGGGVIL